MDCYVMPEQIPEVGVRRRWLYRGQVRSAEWCNGGIIKGRDRFDAHPDDDSFRALLEECERRGVTRPSSYGDIFHQSIVLPVARRHVAKLFPTVPGAWQVIRDPERLHAKGRAFDVPRPLWQYDMRSAYLWALRGDLPDPRTFRAVRRVTGPGLYWCPSPNDARLPFPWNSEGIYPATEEEIAGLPLPWREVTRGIRYDPETYRTDQMAEVIRSFSCHKEIGRAYWGRWGARSGLVAQSLKHDTVTREWSMTDPRKHPVWAAIITSRVRMHLWRAVDSPERRVYRCYVDSVVTDEPMDESPEVGGWVLKATFPRGARINVAGAVPLDLAA